MAVNREVVPIADLNQLDIATRKQGTTVTVELAGALDLDSATALHQATASPLTRRTECLVLDLSRLAFIDASGLHATVELAQHAAANHIRLVIIPGSPAVQRVFEITALAERLPFINQADAAERRCGTKETRGAPARAADLLPR
jgi:anti-anti-sigma factor